MCIRDRSNLYPPLENHPSDEIMMKVEDFTSIHPRSFRQCSFELKKGEILGVAGLVGAQRTELMEGIFGLRAHTAGKVWIKGQEVTIKQPPRRHPAQRGSADRGPPRHRHHGCAERGR